MRIYIVLLVAVLITACTTDAPVRTGKDTYLVQGGIGLVAPPPDKLIKQADDFCAKQGKMAVVNEITPWIPGRQFPNVQFTCTNHPTPSHLRPDNGVITIQHQ